MEEEEDGEIVSLGDFHIERVYSYAKAYCVAPAIPISVYRRYLSGCPLVNLCTHDYYMQLHASHISHCKLVRDLIC